MEKAFFPSRQIFSQLGLSLIKAEEDFCQEDDFLFIVK